MSIYIFTPQFSGEMTLKHLIATVFICFFQLFIFSAKAQSSVTVNKKEAAVTNSGGRGATVNKTGASATGNKGGAATINNTGTSIKNGNGAGVSADKQGAAAKSSNGNGASVGKKGVEVKGGSGGMTIDKRNLQIKSKSVNIKLGK